MERDIVVTGMGCYSPAGCSPEEMFANIGRGKTFIAPMHDVMPKEGSTVFASQADEYPCADTDAYIDNAAGMLVYAVKSALADAGIDAQYIKGKKAALIMGSCCGGVQTLEKLWDCRDKENIDYAMLTQIPVSILADTVAKVLGLEAMTLTVSDACASGTIPVIYGSRLIRNGSADIVITGGSDTFSDFVYSGFSSLRSLDPQPCSPFYRSSGLTLGEGAGALVLESRESALSRSAKVYCRVLGGAVNQDSYHITSPVADGSRLADVLEKTLERSGITSGDVDYINAHGTGTEKNDQAENAGFSLMFSGENKPVITSVKWSIGHCLGAAGALELIYTIKVLSHGCAAGMPCVEGGEKDGAKLSQMYQYEREASREIKYAISDSLAFGGVNSAAAIASPEAKAVPLVEDTSRKVYIVSAGLALPFEGADESVISAAGNARAVDEDITRSGKDIFDGFRRMNRLGKLAAVSSKKAADRCGLGNDDLEKTGIIFGTGIGPMVSICDYYSSVAKDRSSCGNPRIFPNTVVNSSACHVSLALGCKGETMTLTDGEMSGLTSLAAAFEIIRSGGGERELVIGADETSQLIADVLKNSGTSPYFEGSGTFIAESGECAEKAGHRPLAEVAGYGWGRSKAGKSCGDAVREAMERAIENSGCKCADTVLVCDAQQDGDETAECMKLGIPVIMPLKNTGNGLAAGSSLMIAYALELLSGKGSGQVLYAEGSPRLKGVPGSILINGRSIDGSRISVMLKSE